MTKNWFIGFVVMMAIQMLVVSPLASIIGFVPSLVLTFANGWFTPTTIRDALDDLNKKEDK